MAPQPADGEAVPRPAAEWLVAEDAMARGTRARLLENAAAEAREEQLDELLDGIAQDVHRALGSTDAV